MRTMMAVFAEELLEAGKKNPNIVAFSADVKRSTGTGVFGDAFPDRYFETGICEQNMVGMATGAALEGKTAVVSTYASFCPGRTWEQLRCSVCLQNADVKVIGAHIGVGSGRDGATHQCFEDIALTSCLPNMRVYSPATADEVRRAARELFTFKGPAYLRLSAVSCSAVPVSAGPLSELSMLKAGGDLAVVATGGIVRSALEAVLEFEAETGKSAAVYDLARLVPFDAEHIRRELFGYKAVISLEEHQLNGGFGSMIASAFAEKGSHPPLFKIGVDGKFGLSADPSDVYERLGLSKNAVLSRLREAEKAVYA